MKVENKLAFFKQAVITEANEKKTRLLAELDSEFTSAVKEIEKSLAEEARHRVQNEKNRIDRNKNKVIIQETTEAKRSNYILKKQMAEEMFADVRKKLVAFTQNREYEEFLMDALEGYLKKQDPVGLCICLNNSDMRFATQVERRFGVEVRQSQDDIIGGFVAVREDKHFVDDRSMIAALADSQEEFKGLG